MKEEDNTAKAGGFKVPASYYETSARNLKHTLGCLEEISEYPALKNLKGKTGFLVPEAYFEKKTELQLSLTIRTQTGGASFQVPDHYFFSNGVKLRAISLKKGAKVRQMFSPAAVWAVAATLLITLGLWFFKPWNSGTDADCRTLACVESADIVKSSAVENLSDDDLMNLIDADLLEEKLLEKWGNKEHSSMTPGTDLNLYTENI